MSDTPAQPAPAAAKSVSAALGLDELLKVTSPRAWIALIALLILVTGVLIWSIVGVIPNVVLGRGVLVRGDVQRLAAPVDGTVKAISVTEQSLVKTGDLVGSLVTATGDSVPLVAGNDGTVTGINSAPGFFAGKGSTIMAIEDLSTPLSAVALVPVATGKDIEPGMEVQLSPSVANVNDYGYLLGTVSDVSEYPVSPTDAAQRIYSGAKPGGELTFSGPQLQVIIALKPYSTTTGYRWSSSQGPDFQLSNATVTDVRVVVDEVPPISYFLPVK